MNAIELIAQALPKVELPEEPQEGICCVTGTKTQTINKDWAIKDSFTNFDLLVAPSSDRISLPAWRVLTYTVVHPDPTKKRDLRPLQSSSWMCDGKQLYLLDRKGVRVQVLNGVDEKQWCGYATTSYKKHGALRAPLNQKSKQIWLFETIFVDCSDRIKVKDTWSKLCEAQLAGISRPLIESLDIAPGYISKIGFKTWITFEHWARPRMWSPLYQFLTYLLPSQEELKCA
jgi:hypothetical protein